MWVLVVIDRTQPDGLNVYGTFDTRNQAIDYYYRNFPNSESWQTTEMKPVFQKDDKPC